MGVCSEIQQVLTVSVLGVAPIVELPTPVPSFAPRFAPTPPPQLIPRWLPRSLALARSTTILSLALSIPDDSGVSAHKFYKQQKELGNDIARIILEIKRLKERLGELQRSPSRLIITGPDEARRVNDEIKVITINLEMLEMQKELLEQYSRKNSAVYFDGDQDDQTIIMDSRIRFLESQLEDFPLNAVAKYKFRTQIAASATAGGTSMAAPMSKRKSEPKKLDGDLGPDTETVLEAIPVGATALLQDYRVDERNQCTVALRITDGVIYENSIASIEAMREEFKSAIDVKVHVTQAMPDHVSDWQYRWLFIAFNIVEEDKSGLRLINEKLLVGLELSDDDILFLRNAENRAQGLVDRYTAENGALRWVNEHMYPTLGSHAMQMAIGAALHNSQPAWAALATHAMVTIGTMQSGQPVADKDLAPSPNVAATSLQTLLMEGHAQAKAELDEYSTRAVIDPQLPLVRTSFTAMQTRKLVGIFANIIGNSGRYSDSTKDDRWLMVSAQILLDGGLEITVEDNGQGMSEDFVVHRLGQFRAQEGRKQVARSSGIGIWSVFDDAKKLGLLPVQVRSAEHVGTTFRVIIPEAKVQWPDNQFTPTADRYSSDVQFGFVIPDAAK